MQEGRVVALRSCLEHSYGPKQYYRLFIEAQHLMCEFLWAGSMWFQAGNPLRTI